MPDWHGYPQHPDAIPERPWWRVDRTTYHRTDGVRLYLEGSELMQDPAALKLPGLVRTGEMYSDAMARIDREHPLPVPEPRLGQSWVSTVHNGGAMVVGLSTSGGAVWGPGDLDLGIDEWPPPGALLVTGPGAPWGDTRP